MKDDHLWIFFVPIGWVELSQFLENDTNFWSVETATLSKAIGQLVDTRFLIQSSFDKFMNEISAKVNSALNNITWIINLKLDRAYIIHNIAILTCIT
jgi:hypothetical protein